MTINHIVSIDHGSNGSKDLSEHFRKKSINWFQKSWMDILVDEISTFSTCSKDFRTKTINWFQKNIFANWSKNGFHQTLVDFIDISSIVDFLSTKGWDLNGFHRWLFWDLNCQDVLKKWIIWIWVRWWSLKFLNIIILYHFHSFSLFKWFKWPFGATKKHDFQRRSEGLEISTIHPDASGWTPRQAAYTHIATICVR